jgi:hypothetical protein
VLPYVVGGVGVVSLAAGAVFGLMAKSKESAGVSDHSQADAIVDRDNGKTLATIANVGFIAGGVLVAAGAVWWVLDRPSTKRPAKVGIALGPSFMTIAGTFQ